MHAQLGWIPDVQRTDYRPLPPFHDSDKLWKSAPSNCVLNAGFISIWYAGSRCACFSFSLRALLKVCFEPKAQRTRSTAQWRFLRSPALEAIDARFSQYVPPAAETS